MCGSELERDCNSIVELRTLEWTACGQSVEQAKVVDGKLRIQAPSRPSYNCKERLIDVLPFPKTSK